MPIPNKDYPPNLTPRWYYLKHHPVQYRVWHDKCRFKVVYAGRRSGKTENAKRKLVNRATTFHTYPDGRFICAAPTLPQAKQIFWNDLKLMVPRWALSRTHRDPIRESECLIHLWNGAQIQVLGMDKPERVEGSPLDGIVLDEYGNMKESAWTEHVRPALSTLGRPGWAFLTGVPEGRNHYYDTAMRAKARQDSEWSAYTWFSSDILDPAEVEAARDELDELVFRQEYEGSFISFEGCAYYAFDREVHAMENLAQYYRSDEELGVALDFNVAPGVAVIVQEKPYLGLLGHMGARFTAVLAEIYIERDSNTERVCREFLRQWGDHAGNVVFYGDATGGARGTSQTTGSDWDVVRNTLKPHFGNRLKFRVARSNPAERARVNAVNSRIRSAAGTGRLLVDPSCTYLIKDLEGVPLDEKGSGAIDKKKYPKLTHISDALGYYVEDRFPTERRTVTYRSI